MKSSLRISRCGEGGQSDISYRSRGGKGDRTLMLGIHDGLVEMTLPCPVHLWVSLLLSFGAKWRLGAVLALTMVILHHLRFVWN
ncbi:uncharacterized protein BDW43DRAFT_274167 [Aspergillus alliaceus]|uniref:uncharacterized protein n=1 Tax=Petromyces alliaceus TaxID=209559 RepID=UPI0012A44EE7|nr:uncharacterized protein BDW43DRAFT_274167 [Aspergillus alliaceus]KAB8234086.1 hypothetical protein BDW43DRAFT_274167 [Aspergillus alliaceus]